MSTITSFDFSIAFNPFQLYDQHSPQSFLDPFKTSNNCSPMLPQTLQQQSWSNNQYQINQVSCISTLDINLHTYMQYIQQIQSLEETIMKLQIENSALEALQSTLQWFISFFKPISLIVHDYRKSYEMLVMQLHQTASSKSLSSGMAITLQAPSQPDLLQLKQDEYQFVRFWMQKNWKEWNESAEGQRSRLNDKNHNMKYLEDKMGQPLDHTHVTNILNCM